ncbi:MAG: HAD-IC family P-type ATPase [Candidatus Gracilibacteria bacterium]
MNSSSYLEKGLSTAEVKSRLAKFGYNEVIVKKHFEWLKILFRQFRSLLILVLIVTGAIAIALHEYTDGLAILSIVVINSMIGFLQEYKAENAVASLKKMIVSKIIVLRNGKKMEIPSRELVPDDIVLLSEGDKIPADMKIIEAFSLQTDESALTGESATVQKSAKEKENLLFKGTVITSGRATAQVIATGKNTSFDKIVRLVSKQEKSISPLDLQLNSLGKKLALVILLTIIVLFTIGFIREVSLIEMFMTSVALGVSAIPEGMPIIVTLTLAMGVQILSAKKAIVRKMNAIETLGATTVICSDKTGTLTLNEMTVTKIYTDYIDREIYGIGYTAKNKFIIKNLSEKKLIEIAENCNNAFVEKNPLGDPTEIALKILALKSGKVRQHKKLDEQTFSSERKMMSTLHRIENKKEIFAKGAFEEIIKRCDRILIDGKIRKITSSDKSKLTVQNNKYAIEALRVLAFAYKDWQGKFNEENLIFVGLVGMFDPPRDTVAESIRIAQKAGIKIKIITGDNPLTARAIAEKIGLKTSKVVTGAEIDKLTDQELKKLIYEADIFARTSPLHKYRIVNLLKRNHEVVAVTGDGINDAPALKHADVGIAMGIKGTEATKEVADIVLKDDNFSTIISTIEEGRRIYKNILAFIKYMISVNFDTITIVGLLTILGHPLPLLPLQILWINIATDALPALALGSSAADPDSMREKPRPKEENIVRKFSGFIIATVIVTTIATLISYFYGLKLHNLDHARTMVFTEIVLFELIFAFVCQSDKKLGIKALFANRALIIATFISLIFQLIMVYTPFMQQIFKTTALDLKEWLVLLLLASTATLVPSLKRIIHKLIKI